MKLKELDIVYQEVETTSEEIAEFESKHGICFPDYFKEFILKYNGCEIEKNAHSEQIAVDNFLPLYSSFNPSIDDILEGYLHNYESRTWLPFGIDEGGWVFVISLHEESLGQVFIDRFDKGEEIPFKKLADSFEDFINALVPEE